MIPGIVAGRAVVGAEGDPYWANVASLLHFDGTDGSTTFTDQKGAIWTPSGAAQIDTAQSKFGGASGLFDGSGDFITRSVPGGFNIGTGEFTLEAWVRLSATGDRTIHSQWSTTTASNRCMVATVSTTSMALYWSTNGISLAGSFPITISLSTGVWYHVAFCRAGSTLRGFINGIQQGAGLAMSDSVFNSTRDLFIGRQDGSSLYDFAGHIDDYRLTVGVGRYSSSFTPPDAPFPNS